MVGEYRPVSGDQTLMFHDFKIYHGWLKEYCCMRIFETLLDPHKMNVFWVILKLACLSVYPSVYKLLVILCHKLLQEFLLYKNLWIR